MSSNWYRPDQEAPTQPRVDLDGEKGWFVIAHNGQQACGWYWLSRASEWVFSYDSINADHYATQEEAEEMLALRLLREAGDE